MTIVGTDSDDSSFPLAFQIDLERRGNEVKVREGERESDRKRKVATTDLSFRLHCKAQVLSRSKISQCGHEENVGGRS
jgi:hypothetical protein